MLQQHSEFCWRTMRSSVPKMKIKSAMLFDDRQEPVLVVWLARSTSKFATQEHMFFENYMTEALWAVIRSDCTLMTDKIRMLAEFAVDDIGLHYPTETTVASIIGILFAAHGRQLSFREANDYREKSGVI